MIITKVKPGAKTMTAKKKMKNLKIHRRTVMFHMKPIEASNEEFAGLLNHLSG